MGDGSLHTAGGCVGMPYGERCVFFSLLAVGEEWMLQKEWKRLAGRPRAR